MDQQTVADVKDAIILLTGHRDPRFRDEAVFHLAELQALIYFPRDPEFVDAARLVVGRILLTSLGERTVRRAASSFEARSASQNVVMMLQDSEYAALFDSIFRDWDWSRMLRHSLSPREFYEAISDRRDRDKAVMHMLDYRYRFIHHRQGRAQHASVSRSWVYSRNTTRPWLGERTIKSRWLQVRETATFIYVLEGFFSDLFPDLHPAPVWLRQMRESVRDRQALRQYFGMCAYVAEQLSGDDQSTDFYPDEKILQRIPPATEPLSEEERGRLNDYKADIEKFNLGRVSRASSQLP